MAHLASSFSSQYTGQLEVVLSGVWYHGTRRDAGFSSNNGTPNVLLRGYVGPAGAYQYTQPIDRYAPVVVLLLDYPGGGVTWNYGTELLANTSGGATGLYSYGFQDLRMDLTLRRNAT
jgi:hypothetical protein